MRNKWVKVKGVVDDSCKEDGFNWKRQEANTSYTQVLDFIVDQLITNVKLDCLD